MSPSDDNSKGFTQTNNAGTGNQQQINDKVGKDNVDYSSLGAMQKVGYSDGNVLCTAGKDILSGSTFKKYDYPHRLEGSQMQYSSGHLKVVNFKQDYVVLIRKKLFWAANAEMNMVNQKGESAGQIGDGNYVRTYKLDTFTAISTTNSVTGTIGTCQISLQGNERVFCYEENQEVDGGTPTLQDMVSGEFPNDNANVSYDKNKSMGTTVEAGQGAQTNGGCFGGQAVNIKETSDNDTQQSFNQDKARPVDVKTQTQIIHQSMQDNTMWNGQHRTSAGGAEVYGTKNGDGTGTVHITQKNGKKYNVILPIVNHQTTNTDGNINEGMSPAQTVGWRIAEKCDFEPNDEIWIYGKSNFDRTSQDDDFKMNQIFFGYIDSVNKSHTSGKTAGTTITITGSDQLKLLQYSYVTLNPTMTPGASGANGLDLRFSLQDDKHFGSFELFNPYAVSLLIKGKNIKDATLKEQEQLKWASVYYAIDNQFGHKAVHDIIKQLCLDAGVPTWYLADRIEPIMFPPYVYKIKQQNSDTLFTQQMSTRLEQCKKAAQKLMLEFFADEEGRIVLKCPNYALGVNSLSANNLDIDALQGGMINKINTSATAPNYNKQAEMINTGGAHLGVVGQNNNGDVIGRNITQPKMSFGGGFGDGQTFNSEMPNPSSLLTLQNLINVKNIPLSAEDKRDGYTQKEEKTFTDTGNRQTRAFNSRGEYTQRDYNSYGVLTKKVIHSLINDSKNFHTDTIMYNTNKLSPNGKPLKGTCYTIVKDEAGHTLSASKTHLKWPDGDETHAISTSYKHKLTAEDYERLEPEPAIAVAKPVADNGSSGTIKNFQQQNNAPYNKIGNGLMNNAAVTVLQNNNNNMQQAINAVKGTQEGDELAQYMSNNNNLIVKSYTVQKGDTLYGLAKKYLHDGNRYGEILAANENGAFKGKLDSDNAADLYKCVGNKIVIPYNWQQYQQAHQSQAYNHYHDNPPTGSTSTRASANSYMQNVVNHYDNTLSELTDALIPEIPQEYIKDFTLTDSDKNIFNMYEVNIEGDFSITDKGGPITQVRRVFPDIPSMLRFGVRPLPHVFNFPAMGAKEDAHLLGFMLCATSLARRNSATLQMIEDSFIRVGNPIRFFAYDEHPGIPLHPQSDTNAVSSSLELMGENGSQMNYEEATTRQLTPVYDVWSQINNKNKELTENGERRVISTSSLPRGNGYGNTMPDGNANPTPTISGSSSIAMANGDSSIDDDGDLTGQKIDLNQQKFSISTRTDLPGAGCGARYDGVKASQLAPFTNAQSIYYIEQISRSIGPARESLMTLSLSCGRMLGQPSNIDYLLLLYKPYYNPALGYTPDLDVIAQITQKYAGNTRSHVIMPFDTLTTLMKTEYSIDLSASQVPPAETVTLGGSGNKKDPNSTETLAKQNSWDSATFSAGWKERTARVEGNIYKIIKTGTANGNKVPYKSYKYYLYDNDDTHFVYLENGAYDGTIDHHGWSFREHAAKRIEQFAAEEQKSGSKTTHEFRNDGVMERYKNTSSIPGISFSVGKASKIQLMADELQKTICALNAGIFSNHIRINSQQFNKLLHTHQGQSIIIPKVIDIGADNMIANDIDTTNTSDEVAQKHPKPPTPNSKPNTISAASCRQTHQQSLNDMKSAFS